MRVRCTLHCWRTRRCCRHVLSGALCREREDVIKTTQDERLKMLQDAILAREAEVEEGHSERVQAVTDRLLASKHDTFASIHKSRIKALRHFTEARKCGPLPFSTPRLACICL